jgi:hypothetical protein
LHHNFIISSNDKLSDCSVVAIHIAVSFLSSYMLTLILKLWRAQQNHVWWIWIFKYTNNLKRIWLSNQIQSIYALKYQNQSVLSSKWAMLNFKNSFTQNFCSFKSWKHLFYHHLSPNSNLLSKIAVEGFLKVFCGLLRVFSGFLRFFVIFFRVFDNHYHSNCDNC